MRRDHGSGSVYKTGDGMWRASIDLGWEPAGRNPDGSPRYRRRRKYLAARTKAAVVAKLKEAKRQLAESTGQVMTNEPTVAQWLTKWVTEIRPTQGVRPRTLQTDRTYVARHLIPHLGRVKLSELSRRPGLIIDLQATLRSMPAARREGTVSEAAVGRAVAVLSAACRDAVRLGYMTRNPCQVVASTRGPGTETTFLDAAGAARMIQHDQDGRWAFALLTGKRQGERLGLRWNLLNLDEGVADISWQLQRLPFRHGCLPERPCGRRVPGRCPQAVLDVPLGFEHQRLYGGLCLTRPKTHVHVIPLVPALVDRLRRRRETAPANPHDLVWATPGGNPIDPRDDYQDWTGALAELGLPRVRPHSARHTCATLLMSLGVPETVIMQLVGHSTIVAARRYIHADLTVARRAAQKLADVLDARPASLDR